MRVFAVLVSVVAVLLAAVGLPAPTAADAAPTPPVFRVGVGRASTAPDGQVCIGGYGTFCTRPSQGIKDPLEARALAITGRGGETAIVVTATAVGWFAAYKDANGPHGIHAVRQRVAQETGVPADHVVIVSDHSHAAPDTIGIWGGVDATYMQRLADGVVAAASDAVRSRRPASLSVATVGGPPLDSSYDRGPTDDAAMDTDFRVLFADAPTGDRIATFVNYAPHATVCGDCDDQLSGDWTAWAAQEAEAIWGGQGFGAVGALGATDWNKSGDLPAREAEARDRLRTLLARAHAARQPVTGEAVGVETTFVREQMAQPVLALNHLPEGTVAPPGSDEGDISIDRSTSAPFLTGTVVGTYASAIRLGDVVMSTFPGEPFPQVAAAIRDAVDGAQAHFVLGAAQDFLGYMVADDEAYVQTVQEGATYLGGCPEEELLGALGVDHDDACPDHFTLMVSPTIGRHLVCTLADAAERLGFAVARADECAALTALDGVDAPAEHPGRGDGPGPDPDPDPDPDPGVGQLRAGVASRDVSWHLGASGGQFSATEPPASAEFVDPYVHATKKRPADAIASRILTRALVVEDGEGDRVAVVANDLYLPNDILNRRVAQLLVEHDLAVQSGLAEGPVTGITTDTLAVTASHNHNSAFYSTPSWGTWIFQDVFDLRFFDHVARGMADAVIAAAGELRPVRMGGATVPFNEISSHTYGPKVAVDGTPAGQPYDHTTGMLSVVRFDDVSDPANPTPYANWVTLGIHPEWTWGYDVVNGDITHAAMKVIDRELGTTTVMSQRETGASGPHKDTRAHPPQARREFQDNGFENLDVAARLWADAVHEAYVAIEQQAATAPYDPADPRRDGAPMHVVPVTSTADVDSVAVRVAPPAERPVPGVSNCNTSALFHGHPQLPILGFPDCEDSLSELGVPLVEATPFEERAIHDQLKAAGVPIPDSYFGPSLTAVEETAAVHLMAFRLGDIAATFCPCEQFTDTALNITTRLDRTPDNEWVGWDWPTQRTPAGRDWCVPDDATAPHSWTCADPRDPTRDLVPVPDDAYRRMLAQVRNDAAGWETDVASLFGASEAADPEAIFGNFTHGERTEQGYGMVVAVGMANDYFGYVPSYREMRSHEHYRKALNGLGLHGADFLATRLVTLAASLNGGAPYVPTPADLAYQAEVARVEAVTAALGELAEADAAAWEAAAYVDGGAPAIEVQPTDITRYDATHITFVGGSNWNDMPVVRVERLEEDGTWVPYADEQGDVPVTLQFPRAEEVPSVVAGEFVWRWTASFEAFGSQVTIPDASGTPRDSTPAGTYRFVVDGHHRATPASTTPYELTSEPFTVSPWGGVQAREAELTRDRVAVTFGPVTEVVDEESGQRYAIGPVDYPDGYDDSPFDLLGGSRRLFTYGSDDLADHQWYCPFCRFHPWADTGEVTSVTVSVVRPSGRVDRVPAVPDADGWWTADVDVRPADEVLVAAGDAVTEHGDVNGTDIHLGELPRGRAPSAKAATVAAEGVAAPAAPVRAPLAGAGVLLFVLAVGVLRRRWRAMATA